MMARDTRILVASTFMALIVSCCGPGSAKSAPPLGDVSRNAGGQRASEIGPQPVARTGERDVSTPPIAIELSPQARQVSQIAVGNGDRDFLMVDKLPGEIYFFKNGQPIFRDAALTGAGTGDRLTPELLAFSFSHPSTEAEKITPAGRFTVAKQFDKSYGTIFEIQEIKGKDWVLAIHPVFLGVPFEKRLLRLSTSSPKDNYTT